MEYHLNLVYKSCQFIREGIDSQFIREGIDSQVKYTQGLLEGGSEGTSYPGLGGPVLKGPRRVQVSALSLGIAP